MAFRDFVFFSFCFLILKSFGQDIAVVYSDSSITYTKGYKGPKQRENLELKKTKSTIFLKTESSVLKVYKVNEGFNKGIKVIGKKEKFIESINQDSLAILLFKNGFLSSELLMKAMAAERFEVNTNGDTTNLGSYKGDTLNLIRDIEILSCKKNCIGFIITIVPGYDLNRKVGDYGSYMMYTVNLTFSLVLISNKKVKLKNLQKFLNEAKISVFYYLGYGIEI